MTSRFLAAFAAFALALPLPACAKKAAPAPDADPALWVVKDKDTTIYLFGTIHVLKPGMTWFDEAVKTAFDRSDTLVLETVLPNPSAMAGLVRATGMAKPGTPPLTMRLPADKRAAFTAAVTASGRSADALDTMQPWLAASQLTMGSVGQFGYTIENAPEAVLRAAAEKAGKIVTGLETPEQQLGFFAQLSDPAQMKLLTETLDETPRVNQTIGQMIDEWAAGKPNLLAARMNESWKSSPEIARVLLIDRNRRWASWIAKRMKTPGTVFIAVGAGHLGGSQSVTVQLARHGVRAQRILY